MIFFSLLLTNFNRDSFCDEIKLEQFHCARTKNVSQFGICQSTNQSEHKEIYKEFNKSESI